MSDHVPLPDPLGATGHPGAAPAPDGPVPGRPDRDRDPDPPAATDAAAPPPSGATEPPGPGADPPAAADDRQELPRLQTPRRGRRLVAKPATPAAPLTPQQRLLLLDAWRRSGLPAGDFAPLCGVSKISSSQYSSCHRLAAPCGCCSLAARLRSSTNFFSSARITHRPCEPPSWRASTQPRWIQLYTVE